jgi:hypothetical protein
MTRTQWRTPALGFVLAVAVGALVAGPGPRADAQSSSSTTTTGALCPTNNAPNELVLVGGTPQTVKLNTAFASPLRVELANTNGCQITSAVTGTAVTFTAPAAGASATFAASGSDTLTVGTDATGSALVQPLTANDTAGSYAVTATCPYGSVSFALTNTSAGMPFKIAPLGPTGATATVAKRYTRRLRVKVGTAAGKPVASMTVTFTLGSASGTGASTGSGGAGAVFTGGSARATVVTGPDGIATSPRITANGQVGGFTATASSSATSREAVFHLRNRAGQPATLAAGVGATQSTAARTRFAIALAVTVRDSYGNRVPGARVTFAAPSSGPGGSFHRRETTATIKTNTSGIAVAPPFTANGRAGGYIVTATVSNLRPVAFALVNTGS